MILWIALGIALVAGLLQPFAKRLNATGLWAGKVLVPDKLASAYPRGIQSALTDGWPSTLSLIVSLLPFIAIVVGLFHAWWAGIVVLIVSVFVAAIADRSSIASRKIDRYLVLYMEHAFRRSTNYTAKGDAQRAKAAEELGQQLQELISIYAGSGVPAPSIKEARSAPFGEPKYLLERYSGVN